MQVELQVLGWNSQRRGPRAEEGQGAGGVDQRATGIEAMGGAQRDGKGCFAPNFGGLFKFLTDFFSTGVIR